MYDLIYSVQNPKLVLLNNVFHVQLEHYSSRLVVVKYWFIKGSYKKKREKKKKDGCITYVLTLFRNMVDAFLGRGRWKL